MVCFRRVPLEFPSAPLWPVGGFRVLIDPNAFVALEVAHGSSASIGVANHSDQSSRQPSQSREPRAALPSRIFLALVGSSSWRRFTLHESCDLGPLKWHELATFQ